MIEKMTVKNFRVFDKRSVTFEPGVNVILGKNGVGKTSLLEAIYFISFTKSFKASQDADMIKHEEDHFQISTHWRGGKYDHAQGNYWKKRGKKFIFDDETMQRLSDIIGVFPLVFQSPEDYRVTAGPSVERRAYFDRFISQISKPYLDDLITYKKLLKNRNAHLKHLNENKDYSYSAQLEIYDEQLSPVMFRIVDTRRNFATLFNKHLVDLYESTFNNKYTGKIVYKPSLTARNEADFQIIHREQTQNNIDKEIILKRTLWGPNYDKYLFMRNDTPLIHYASQGEHKIWMTLLKLAEGAIIKNIKGEEPVYLLDDLFAELDLNNSRRIIDRIKDAKQVLITTTDMSDLRRHGIDIDHVNIITIDS
jgi:DNA replication and repair protein RecF